MRLTRCKKCGADVPAGACPSCGTARPDVLVRRCDGCGGLVHAESQVCPWCGAVRRADKRRVLFVTLALLIAAVAVVAYLFRAELFLFFAGVRLPPLPG